MFESHGLGSFTPPTPGEIVNHPRRIPLLAVGVLTALLAAACGGNQSNEGSANADSPSVTAGGGGKPADNGLPPVLVGFHGLEGGQISLADMRLGFEAGVDYVNQELGGINGHPLRAEICKTDVTPESSVNCANKFVSQNVVLAVQGVDYAGDAALPVLKQAGIVDVSAFAYGPSENTALGDAYISEGSNEEGYASSLVALKKLGATSVAEVLADVPANHTIMTKVIKPAADKLGLKLSPFFYPAQTDWTSFAATVVSAKVDGVTLFATDADCLGAVPALRSSGYTGLIHAGVCSVVVDKLNPSMLKNVIIGSPFYNSTMTPIPAGPQKDLDIFSRYMAAHKELKNRGQAQQGFFVAVWAADMLRQIPGDPLTAKTVHDNIGKTKGPLLFRTNGYDCSKPTWPGTTACGGGYIFTKATADRKNEVLPDQPVDVSVVLPTS
ncbi:ABC transporter substrate-binding protein [Dactylosporangium sp. CA-092794]|uniref:ABC transporter substrate-binding protein n=1 Tax=Dactylosporangium sp. CA-092794 TaxID=3239929 RepID=UPI003D91C251